MAGIASSGATLQCHGRYGWATAPTACCGARTRPFDAAGSIRHGSKAVAAAQQCNPWWWGGFRRMKRREGPDGVVWFGRADSGPCELGPSKTVVSVAGVGAYDIARAAMFERFHRDARLASLIPFVSWPRKQVHFLRPRTHAELGPRADLYAFLDDTYAACDPADACAAFVSKPTPTSMCTRARRVFGVP